jgi:hypothetical protein
MQGVARKEEVDSQVMQREKRSFKCGYRIHHRPLYLHDGIARKILENGTHTHTRVLDGQKNDNDNGPVRRLPPCWLRI